MSMASIISLTMIMIMMMMMMMMMMMLVMMMMMMMVIFLIIIIITVWDPNGRCSQASKFRWKNVFFRGPMFGEVHVPWAKNS